MGSAPCSGVLERSLLLPAQAERSKLRQQLPGSALVAAFGSKSLKRAGVPFLGALSTYYSSVTLCSVAINLLKYHLFLVIHSYPLLLPLPLYLTSRVAKVN